MDERGFTDARSYAYHLTGHENVDRIRATHELESARMLFSIAGREDLDGLRRKERVVVSVEGTDVLIRDQKPLHEGNMDLGTWSFEDLIRSINSRVFLWVGTKDNPGRHCLRYHARYAGEESVILRVRTCELLVHGSGEVCRYNSGAPRWSGGKPSPRGPDTFVPLEQFEGKPSQVVELAFPGAVRLPESTEIASSLTGPWRRLS